MQNKLKIITVFAAIFVFTSLIVQYYHTTDISIVSFRNYVQDLSNILKGQNITIPENKVTTTNVKVNEVDIAERNDFDYNVPITEVDKKSLLRTATKKVSYENQIRLEAPEQLDANGLYVALMQAVADNNMKRAKTLIARGARLDTPDGDTSFAPIFWAIDNGNVEMVKLLLSKGARVNTPDDNGLFPVHWIVRTASKRPNVYQMKAIFDVFLAAHPNEINRQDTKLKQTPIMFAVISGNKKAFAYLLDKGANLNITNWENMNIVNMSVSNACHACVYLIEEKENLNKTTPLPNFAQDYPQPDPIWLPYMKQKTTGTTTQKKQTKRAPKRDQDVIVITGSGSNLSTPEYKDMPQILPLEEEPPDFSALYN